MPKSYSVGIQVLDFIAQSPGISAEAMADKIKGGWVSAQPAYRQRSVNHVISDLLDMGLIAEREGLFYPAFPAAEPPLPPPRDRQPPDGDDSEGAGMRQLLAHPYLFVLRREEIAERVKNALEVP